MKGSRAASGTRDVSCQRPADECISVPVPHAVLGLQVTHDCHMLLQSAVRDDLLPLRDRAPVLLLDGREIRGRSLLRPGRRLLGHVDVFLSLTPAIIRRPAGLISSLFTTAFPRSPSFARAASL